MHSSTDVYRDYYAAWRHGDYHAAWRLADQLHRAETLREAAEAERQQAAETAELRRLGYAAAEEAAFWRGGFRRGFVLPDDVRALQVHAVNLATVAPAITIRWLKPCEQSTVIVGHDNAAALSRQHTIVCPGIIDVPTAVVVLHEIGHVRTWTSNQSELQRECAAWRWARQHALTWDDAAQRRMYECLQTYLKSATLSNIVDVLDAEQLCSRMEFLREQQRRVELQLRYERVVADTRPEFRRAPSEAERVDVRWRETLRQFHTMRSCA
jgi:hypothetical protein